MINRISSACVLLIAAQGISAQEVKTSTNELGQTVEYVRASSYNLSPAFSDLPEDEISAEKKEVYNRKGELTYNNDYPLPDGVDPVLQTEPPTRAAAQTLVNILGVTGNGLPPDPSGAAGPNHYVQAVNTSIRIYDKTGSALSGSSLAALWPGSSNEGDPIVMYDRHADRWFMSQFQFSPNEILIAISQTPDPTGSWHTYSFPMQQFPDYPKYSIWWDGYYMTSNSTHTAVAFERDKMLVGDPNAGMVRLSAPSVFSNGFRSPLPADADGPLPPNGTPMYIFNLEDNGFPGVTTDRIKVYEFIVDWNNTNNSQVSVHQVVTTAPFDTNLGFGFDNISQPGTSQKLDAIPGVLMYRAQHMRWNGYNTIVLSHVVDVNGQNHAGIRWYELRDQDDGNWFIHQQGTYSPDDGDRFMSSAAMDNAGNIAMAYSYANASAGEGAGLRYTARWAQDTPGTMSLFESEAVAGNGAQTNSNRFGDYGHLALDPDGSTFWYTGEYLIPSQRTRIFSFNIQSALGVDAIDPAAAVDLTLSQLGNDIIVNANGIDGKDVLAVELINLHGKVLKRNVPAKTEEGIRDRFAMGNHADGVYFVRILTDSFQKVDRIVFTR